MALDAVVFPQDPFNHPTNKDLYNLLGGNWGYEEDHQDHHQDHQLQPSFDFPGYQTDQTYPNTYDHYDHCTSHYSSPPSMVPHFNEMHIFNAISPTDHDQQSEFQLPLDHATMPSTTSTRAKRRRAKSRKNNEEIENQRIIHIAVERNRRKQMNEYLSLLRSLMPDSYVQKGDQASIIGGAINFVKELEQHAQFLGVFQKPSNCVPFSDFFTFPQYSARSGSTSSDEHESAAAELPLLECRTSKTSNIAADIEVAMVESHVSLKVRSKKLPKQLLKIVSGLEAVHLTVLHLNVVTANDVVLYSLSLKVEDECMLTSVDEIAAAVHEMLATIQQEAILNLN